MFNETLENKWIASHGLVYFLYNEENLMTIRHCSIASINLLYSYAIKYHFKIVNRRLKWQELGIVHYLSSQHM